MRGAGGREKMVKEDEKEEEEMEKGVKIRDKRKI